MTPAGHPPGDEPARPGESAPDEELAATPQRNRRARFLRFDLGVGAVLLVGTALVAQALARSDHDPGSSSSPAASSPAAVSSPAASPQAGSSPAVSTLPVPPLPSSTDVERCPATVRCFTAKELTVPARQAMAAAFPGSVIISARTIRLYVKGYGQALWFVEARARAGTRTVLLRLQARRAKDHKGHSTMLFGSHSLTRYEATLTQFHVLIQVVAPAGEDVPLGALASLAADTRLLAPY